MNNPRYPHWIWLNKLLRRFGLTKWQIAKARIHVTRPTKETE